MVITREMGSHILNTNIMVGSRLPSYRTAPGLSIMSQMRQPEVLESVTLGRGDDLTI